MIPARLLASIEQVALVDDMVGGEVLLPDLLLQSTGKVPTATWDMSLHVGPLLFHALLVM